MAVGCNRLRALDQEIPIAARNSVHFVIRFDPMKLRTSSLSLIVLGILPSVSSGCASDSEPKDGSGDGDGEQCGVSDDLLGNTVGGYSELCGGGQHVEMACGHTAFWTWYTDTGFVHIYEDATLEVVYAADFYFDGACSVGIFPCDELSTGYPGPLVEGVPSDEAPFCQSGLGGGK